MISTILNGIRDGNLSLPMVITQLVALLTVIFLVLPFHEWAHAFTAMKLGDTSIKYRKRLTLNPVEHIDPVGALMLLLFGFGWAKPVPVNDRNFKNPKLYMAITALAGPLANIAAAMVGGLLLNAVVVFGGFAFISNTVGMIVFSFLSFYISVNISLAVFNLLPIPPLDGSKILFAFLPYSVIEKIYRYERYISIALIVLLFAGVLDFPISFLSNWIYKFVMWLTGLPFAWFA